MITTAMAVVLRLQRIGAKKAPIYRLVAADRRRATVGTIIERVGHYDPRGKDPQLKVVEDRLHHWLKVGAKPSDTVRTLLSRNGIWPKKTKV